MWDWILNKSKYLMVIKESVELLLAVIKLCQKVTEKLANDGKITANEYPDLIMEFKALASEAKDVVEESKKLKGLKKILT